MPESSDYAALAELLDDPSLWTPEQEQSIRMLRVTQQQLLDSAHPLDKAGRDRLRQVVADLDRAIARREAQNN